MRHNKNFNHLGRQAGHRKAMLSNMATSLILHKRIETTVAKAKAVQRFVEPLVTKSKEDTTHSRRIVFSYLKQKEAVTELFRTIAPKISERPGGYTRILKTGFRLTRWVSLPQPLRRQNRRRAVRASRPPRLPTPSRRLPSSRARLKRPHPRRLPPRRSPQPRRPLRPRLRLRRLRRRPMWAKKCSLLDL